MRTFTTDLERFNFLLETEADFLYIAEMSAQGDSKTLNGDTGRPKYTTNYIGSKQKLLDWIWQNVPEGAESALDAFTGSAVVAYMFKSKGLKVIANDRLKFAYHAARAIVENDKTTLSDADVESLLKPARSENIVRDKFKELFFADGVHEVIDTIRANIDKLSGYKKDIALFALAKTCIVGKGGFGHFATPVKAARGDDPEAFANRFRETVSKSNALVFDNGFACKAYNKDINDVLASADVDVAYFDPPYATEFSKVNYEHVYHFIEGLMTNWAGLEFNEKSTVKAYAMPNSKTVTKDNSTEFFTAFLGKASHIPNWLISYRDHAYPNEDDMKSICASLGRNSRMESHSHKYSMTGTVGGSVANELLFVCQKSGKEALQKAAAAMRSDAPANLHTSFLVDLSAEACTPIGAMDMPGVYPTFNFKLCHEGVNKNGDCFIKEELSARYATVINKKIDLKHNQDITDIVGGVTSADYVEESGIGRIDCVGELFTCESEDARLAYVLLKKKIVTQVSMECDYESGECSICGKQAKSKADYCIHLQKYKGQEFQGKPCFETLHGVTFTGLGLLDRPGADPNAKITQVASENKPEICINEMNGSETNTLGDQTMEDENKKEAAKNPDGGGGIDLQARIKELEAENKTLLTQVDALTKQVAELEASQKSAANRSRASKLISKIEKGGLLAFDTDEDREAELSRIAELSDEAYTATECAFAQLAKKASKATSESEQKTETPKAEAKTTTTTMKTSADVRPKDVEENGADLTSCLTNAFMEYRK